MSNDLRVGFSLAINSLRRGNKKTTILTIIVLMLIFVNLVFLPALITGVMNVFVSTITDYVYGDITIEPLEGKAYISNANSIIKTINNINGVVAASKRLTAGATLTHKEKFTGANILGIIPEDEALVSKFEEVMKEGEFLSSMSRNEIVLGAYVSGEEGGPEILQGLGGIKTGTLINVTYSNGVSRDYKVKGIFKGGQEVSDTVALVHYKELESVLGVEGQDKASSILIKVEKTGMEPDIKNELISFGVKEDIQTWQDKVKDIIQDTLRIFDMLTITTRIVSFIIAIFVLFIIIYINTLNKRRQIGILKAIGITQKSIIISRMIMSIFYTISGLLVGGIVLALIIAYFNYNPIHFYESMYVIPKITSYYVIEGVIGLLITSLIAGFFPAWLVTREPILKAIWGR